MVILQSAMPQVLIHKKTVQDFMHLPEGPPYYQLLNGELIMSPAPNRKHQELIGDIFSHLYTICTTNNMGKVYIAPFDVYLDEDNVVEPDISFFSKERLAVLSDRGAEEAPDLVIEVLSPTNAYYDLRYKLDLYEKHGVKEYFIVDPEDNMVVAYRHENSRFTEQYREKNLIRSSVLQIEIKW